MTTLELQVKDIETDSFEAWVTHRTCYRLLHSDKYRTAISKIVFDKINSGQYKTIILVKDCGNHFKVTGLR